MHVSKLIQLATKMYPNLKLLMTDNLSLEWQLNSTKFKPKLNPIIKTFRL